MEIAIDHWMETKLGSTDCGSFPLLPQTKLFRTLPCFFYTPTDHSSSHEVQQHLGNRKNKAELHPFSVPNAPAQQVGKDTVNLVKLISEHQKSPGIPLAMGNTLDHI